MLFQEHRPPPPMTKQPIGKQRGSICINLASCHDNLCPCYGNEGRLSRVTGGFRAVCQERLAVRVMWADIRWRSMSGWQGSRDGTADLGLGYATKFGPSLLPHCHHSNFFVFLALLTGQPKIWQETGWERGGSDTQQRDPARILWNLFKSTC